MIKTRVSSKGQTTIPDSIRSRWKASEVIWEAQPDGSARVRPVPDLLSLYGSARSAQPRDPDEKAKARGTWGRKPAGNRP